MPYCSQCGTGVADTDIYCAKCGRKQPVSATPAFSAISSIAPRTASILCYIPFVGWIASIIVLASDRFRDNRLLRFHAFQGLYLFVAWLIVEHVVLPAFRLVPGPMHGMGNLMQALILGLWIYMMIKASQEKVVSIPIIAELADRSVSERPGGWSL